jgi:hypothetical protein
VKHSLQLMKFANLQLSVEEFRRWLEVTIAHYRLLQANPQLYFLIEG